MDKTGSVQTQINQKWLSLQVHGAFWLVNVWPVDVCKYCKCVHTQCSLEGLFITLFFLLSPWHQWDVMQRQGCNHCALKRGGKASGVVVLCSVRTGFSCRNSFKLWMFVSTGASLLTTLKTTQQLSWCSSSVDVWWLHYQLCMRWNLLHY